MPDERLASSAAETCEVSPANGFLRTDALVGIAAVILVSDSVYYEVAHAFVTARDRIPPKSAELERWCWERVANSKVPRQIVVRDELPLLPVAKVDERALAATPDRSSMR